MALNAYRKRGSFGFAHRADVRQNTWEQSNSDNSNFYCNATALLKQIKTKLLQINTTRRALCLSSRGDGCYAAAFHKHPFLAIFEGCYYRRSLSVINIVVFFPLPRCGSTDRSSGTKEKERDNAYFGSSTLGGLFQLCFFFYSICFEKFS